MKLVKEHINFTRGLEPKQAMGTGMYAHLKERMNGILVTHDIGWYIGYIEQADYSEKVDENTGEVGWPYIDLHVSLNSLVTILPTRKAIEDDLKYIFKELGIKGTLAKVETRTTLPYLVYDYNLQTK